MFTRREDESRRQKTQRRAAQFRDFTAKLPQSFFDSVSMRLRHALSWTQSVIFLRK
jgi:hypothetical protein